MFPLRDSIPSRTTPWVNYALIAACTLAFAWQLLTPAGAASAVERYGMIPARVLDPQAPVLIESIEPVRTPFGVELVRQRRPAAPADVPPWLTLLTCIFLHGGWLHFLGNMWFLWIFGDNVEDRLGHRGYLLFYLGCGVAASATHLLTNLGSTMPTIGASGAIAGVMGAYMFLYPAAKVIALVPILFFIDVWVLPAWVFLGVWLVVQLLQGTLSVGAIEAGGVAWWAHIGGFAVGLLVAMLLGRRGWVAPPVRVSRPGTERTHRRMVYPRRGADGRWHYYSP